MFQACCCGSSGGEMEGTGGKKEGSTASSEEVGREVWLKRLSYGKPDQRFWQGSLAKRGLYGEPVQRLSYGKLNSAARPHEKTAWAAPGGDGYTA